MAKRYGFSKSDWDSAKEEIKLILIDIARQRSSIAYSELATQIKTIKIEAHDPRLAHLLGEVSTEEEDAGRGMLTVIVVHKGGDMRPGPGFFELAKSLGKGTSDITSCWIKELNYVHDYWANQTQS